jgi:NADH:ubiquinone oxidoreductase subunit 5 (subunit L)/multisubunit Na+/H+ antiporter MnhA subunit
MNMAGRLRSVGIALAICIVAAPIAIVGTIAFIPFWSWIESRFEIESIGHSGPAEWCYLATYIIILICACFVWRVIRHRADA